MVKETEWSGTTNWPTAQPWLVHLQPLDDAVKTSDADGWVYHDQTVGVKGEVNNFLYCLCLEYVSLFAVAVERCIISKADLGTALVLVIGDQADAF